MGRQAFKKLVGHLDSFPLSFSDAENEAAAKLLGKFFTLPQAELAVHLPIMLGDDPVGLETIAHKMETPAAQVRTVLDPMVNQGLIYVTGQGEDARYSLLPFVPGILEFNVDKIDAEVVQLMGQLHLSKPEEETKSKLPLTRVIPIDRSLEPETKVHPYENVLAFIESSTNLCLMDCMCRTATKQVGRDCGRPIETCLYMNEYADYLIRIGKGRKVTVQEAVDVLNRAEDAGLIHLANNAKGLFGICSCCGCCCMALRGLTVLKNPDAVSKSDFRLVVDAEACTACETCIDRCWVGALKLVEEQITADLDRCLGCGVCVHTCPTGALTLERRPSDEAKPLATDFKEQLEDMGWRR
jgi:electron transport complex protein RnfB